MTSRELRKQRREAERKAKNLAYRQSRLESHQSSVSEPAAAIALPPNPELFDEFSAAEQAEMMALRARVHDRAAVPQSSLPARPGATGPRSAQGKATSSGNSLKHGLASGRILIPGEDAADFEALLAGLITEHAPATETEQLLVKQMAQSWWLTQRAVRLQNEAFTETGADAPKLALFLRYQTTHERAFYKALSTLLKLRAEARKSDPEFVSQNRHQTRRPQQFVSQNSVLEAAGFVGPPFFDRQAA